MGLIGKVIRVNQRLFGKRGQLKQRVSRKLQKEPGDEPNLPQPCYSVVKRAQLSSPNSVLPVNLRVDYEQKHLKKVTVNIGLIRVKKAK